MKTLSESYKRFFMVKPFYLSTKRHGGNFYVQFSLQNGSRPNVKSTGCRDRKEAEKMVMNWLVNGNIPSRINGKEETKATLTVDKMSFFTMFHSFDFTSDDVTEMLKIMKERTMIISAVVPDTPEAKPVKEFLCDFWNMEKSPYVAEKKLKGQQIHLNYCETMRSRITIYWLPRLKGRTVGSITIDDVSEIAALRMEKECRDSFSSGSNHRSRLIRRTGSSFCIVHSAE